MNFNNHSRLKGQHAFLGASKYHWINYDENKLISSYNNFLAVERGTELHDFAERCIRLKQRLPKSKKTLNMYVNDAISLGLTPEQVLYYSDNCFGTTDCIDFRNDILRIHDLKTGVTPAHMEQLYIYAALFCLEYGVHPNDISIVCRIYQSDEVMEDQPPAEIIIDIMQKIVEFDRVIQKLKERE